MDIDLWLGCYARHGYRTEEQRRAAPGAVQRKCAHESDPGLRAHEAREARQRPCSEKSWAVYDRCLNSKGGTKTKCRRVMRAYFTSCYEGGLGRVKRKRRRR